MLPIFADHLKTGPEGLGWLRAAPSIGAFVIALWLTQRPPRKNVGYLLLGSVAGFGICMILFALSGGLDGVSVVVRSAVSSSNELGAFESGLAAKWMGAIPSVILGGTMTLLVVAITALSSKDLRKLNFESETPS